MTDRLAEVKKWYNQCGYAADGARHIDWLTLQRLDEIRGEQSRSEWIRARINEMAERLSQLAEQEEELNALL